MDSANPNEGSDSQNIATKAAALLLVIGEPFTEDHKKLILEEVTKGFGCWETEASGIDINDELAQIANKADLGEEGPDGERIIRHNTESFATEILVNPQIHTVTSAVKNFLAIPTKHKHLIHAGHAFQGSGAWILQDDTYTFNNFVQAFKDQDVSNSLKQQEGSSLYIYTGAGCDWSDSHVAGKDFSKVLKVKVNPNAELDNINGVLQFTAYVSNFVKVRKLNELLQSTDVVGNIRFSRPTLYIFPGCQGDSALFGMSGFNLLVNGGYSRKACFWDFTRHLDRIDAALVTHLGTDNLFGFSSVLQRKSTENVHPEIGYMYINASDKIRALTEQDNNENKEATLAVNLAEEGNKLIQYAKQIGQLPQPCTRSQTIEPINLYHKVGIGSMDMYILNPITDSKELKEFYQQWNQRVAQFGISQHVPLPNNLSVCALLVWRPSDPNDNITRIFFPGNAPQHKVLEGLEKLKTLNILKSAKCTQSSLSEKPTVKKPGALASKAPVRSKVSPLPTPKNEAATKSEPVKKASSVPKPRPSSAQKAKKENDNKKTSKVAEKTTKNGEKVDKAKSSASSSPSKSSLKSSAASTPKETSSPTKEAEQSALEKVPNLIDHQDDIQRDIINGEIEQTASQVDLLSAPIQPEPTAVDSLIGEPLPPQELVHPGQTEALDKEKLKELGIYDEDQDIEEDLNSQQDDKPEDDREQQMFGGMTDSMHEDLIGGLKTSDPMQSSFHGSLMTGSIHESMFDDKQPFDGYAQNGGAIEEVTTPEDDTSEEIQPQALPEPKAYTPATYGQEPDIIPSVALKEESQIVTENELQPATVEPDLVPSKQENTDDLSLSQDVGDDSTIPVEDKSNVQVPVELETPDEIENVIPEDEGFSQLQTEDIQEKDITEQNEKELVVEESETQNNEELETEEDFNGDKTKPSAFDTFEEKCEAPKNGLDTEIVDDLQSTQSQQIISKDENLQQELGQDILGGDFDNYGKTDAVVYAEERDSDDQNEEEPVTKEGFYGNDIKTTDLDRFEDKHEAPENGLDTEIIGMIPSAQTEQLADDSIESAEAEYEKDPQSDLSLEPEIAEQVATSELEDAQSELERPKSPEPSEAEQEASPEFQDDDQIPVDAGMVEEISQVPTLKSESDKDIVSERVDSEMIENDYNEEEEKVEQFKKEESDELENAQVPVQQIETNEDFLPEDKTEEALIPQEQEEQHMLEQERVIMPDSPDSEIERSGTPDSQVGAAEINRDSLEKDQAEEISHTSDMPHEQRDSIEKESFAKEESLALQDGQSEPRDSIERSFEDETDDSEEEDEDDDEEDEDSSSFEQEENTDEKCLIQDSVSEEPKGVSGEGDKALETDSLAAPPDSLMDQPTDNLMSPCSENMYTPESEMTDPSHGGQLGYHQMAEQDDADSVEGLEDNSELSPQQPPLDPVPVKEDYHQIDQHIGPTSGPTNPFDLQENTGYNPFTGTEQQQHDPHQDLSSDDEENDAIQAGGPADFNPVAEWGEPMGLPSPAPPEDKGAASAKSPRPKSASKTLDSKKKDDLKKTDQKANGAVKKMDFKKPPATKKAIPSAKPSPKQSNGEAEKSKPKVSSANSSLNTSKVSSTATGRLSLGGKTTTSKMRPTSAPLNKNKTDPSTAKANGVKRPSTAAGTKSAASAVKMPPLPPFTPFYVDLTYIPNHGNTQYSDGEFFKRVRARYYVLSTLSPNTQVLDSLLDAKNTWEDKDLPVTVIPTYDNETLRLWMVLHKEKLADQKVEIAPSANRCTIQLQDHETSCSAYRLEF